MTLIALLSIAIGAVVATLRTAAHVQMVVVLAAGQLLSHALLSAAGHSHPSAASAPFGLMLAAHLAAIAVGAALIAVGEHLCLAISGVVTARLRHPRPPVTTPGATIAHSADQPLQSVRLLSASLSHRGPPVSLAR